MKIDAPSLAITMVATFAAIDPSHAESAGMVAEMKESQQQMSAAEDDWDEGVIAGGLIVAERFDPINTGYVDRHPDGSIKYEEGIETPSVALLGTYTRDQLLALVIEMSPEVKAPVKGAPT